MPQRNNNHEPIGVNTGNQRVDIWLHRFVNGYGPWAILSALFLAGVCLTNGIYDTGDSLTHYQYARWAPIHPTNYLNHWAKPFFTLVASPWAQLGFDGLRVFNALLGILSAALCVNLARRMQLPFAGLVSVALFAAPQFILVHYSGLTEPFFAFMLIFGVWLWARGKFVAAAVVVGLLPFVRSEGMIYQLLLLGLLTVQNRWKTIPWLGFGHILYGLAGWLAMGWSPLWYFTHNPYDGSNTAIYGIGTWSHFLEKLPNLLGVPLAALFGLGVVCLAWYAIRNIKIWNTDDWLLRIGWVLGGGLALLGAHTVFWAVGGFNSFGMLRVLVASLPLMALIAHYGAAAFLTIAPKGWARIALGFGVLAYCVVFPFIPNPSALKIPNEFQTHPDITLVRQLNVPALATGQRVLATNAAVLYVWQFDPFDTNQVLPPGTVLSALKPGDVLVWDDWFGQHEGGILAQALEDTARLIPLQTARGPEDHPRVIRVFRIR